MASLLDDAINSIRKQYGNSVILDKVPDIRSSGILSLGSPMADYCLYGGLPEGRIVEFFGPEGGGKTSTAFLVAASYQREELKRHPVGEEWTDIDGRVHVGPRAIYFLDNEGTLDHEWAKVFGYDVNNSDVPTKLGRPTGQTAEQLFDGMICLLKTGEVGLLIIDSLATLVPEQIMDEDFSQKERGGIAKSLTRFVNTAIGILRKYNSTLIGINQVRERMDQYGDPEITPGGRAWRHACSSRIKFKRGDFFDEKGNKLTTSAESPAGHIVNLAIVKTKTSAWDRKGGSYRLNYSKGIDILSDTVEAAIHLGFIDNSTKGYFKLVDIETGEILTDETGKEIKLHGKSGVTKYFNDNPSEWKKLYDKVYDKLSVKADPYIKSFEQMLNDNVKETFGEIVPEED